jgi:hypothetical protein
MAVGAAVLAAALVVWVAFGGDEDGETEVAGSAEQAGGDSETAHVGEAHAGGALPTAGGEGDPQLGALDPIRRGARLDAGQSAGGWPAAGSERGQTRSGSVTIDVDPAAIDRQGPASSGAALGQTRRLIESMRGAISQLERAVAEAEREGDAERAATERTRLERVQRRVEELEQHAVELERQAREEGTLEDAEQTGPARVGVGPRQGAEPE